MTSGTGLLAHHILRKSVIHLALLWIQRAHLVRLRPLLTWDVCDRFGLFQPVHSIAYLFGGQAEPDLIPVPILGHVGGQIVFYVILLLRKSRLLLLVNQVGVIEVGFGERCT